MCHYVVGSSCHDTSCLSMQKHLDNKQVSCCALSSQLFRLAAVSVDRNSLNSCHETWWNLIGEWASSIRQSLPANDRKTHTARPQQERSRTCLAQRSESTFVQFWWEELRMLEKNGEISDMKHVDLTGFDSILITKNDSRQSIDLSEHLRETMMFTSSQRVSCVYCKTSHHPIVGNVEIVPQRI